MRWYPYRLSRTTYRGPTDRAADRCNRHRTFNRSSRINRLYCRNRPRKNYRYMEESSGAADFRMFRLFRFLQRSDRVCPPGDALTSLRSPVPSTRREATSDELKTSLRRPATDPLGQSVSLRSSIAARKRLELGQGPIAGGSDAVCGGKTLESSRHISLTLSVDALRMV